MISRPPFWATLLTLAGFIVLLALGTWQVQRLHWKRDLLNRIEQAYQAQNPPVSGYPDIARLSALSRIRVRGTYDHENEILIQPRTWQGRAGYHAVTPLRLEGGGAILVNRGWIPYDEKEQSRRPESLRGIVDVTGLLRRPEPGNFFTPENRPSESIWFSIDPAQMIKKTGPVVPLVLYADAESGNPPLPVREALYWRPPNNHAGYALFWYSMALTLAAVYYLRFIRGSREKGEHA